MGKSSRIREQKAYAPKKPASVNRKNKKDMPSWLMTTITIVIAVAILAGVALSLLSANGVFSRMDTIVSTDNYKVNANMMSYYFYTNYNEFYSQYSSYIGDMLDTSISLKEQEYTAATETSPAVTWYDYFMDQTVESVKSILYYCEEADALGLKLEDADLEEIETALDSIASTASMYGYTTDAYISNIYGPGVKKTDVRKAMKYSALANKCMIHISDDLEGKITEDRIDSEYAADKKQYNVIDYSSYTFTVSYKDIAKEVLGASYTDADLSARKDEVLTAYKKAIQEAKDKANAIKSEEAVATDAFLKAILTPVTEKEFETAYGAKTIADTDKPTPEDFETIKAGLIAEVVAEALEEGRTIPTNAVKDHKAYGIAVNEAYEKILIEVKKTVFDKVLAQKETSTSDKASYSESNEFLKWAFDEGRFAGETTVISTGDGKDDATFESPSTANVTVYLLRTPQFADETKSRDIAYILFSSKTAAENAITELAAKGALTLEAFEAYAEACTTASGHNTIEDYTKGSLGSDVFDTWAFANDTLPGMVTSTPLTLSENSFAVAYYAAEGAMTWRVDVKSEILNKDYEAYYTEMVKKYETTVRVQESLDDVVEA